MIEEVEELEEEEEEGIKRGERGPKKKRMKKQQSSLIFQLMMKERWFMRNLDAGLLIAI